MSVRVDVAAPSHLVAPILAFARERGVRIDLAALGLPDDAGDETPITPRAIGALFDAAAAAFDDPHLGLRLPGALVFTRYELPELAARSSPTLRASFQMLSRYAPLLSDSLMLGLTEAGGVARLTQQTHGHPRGLSRHLNEFAMAMGTHEARARTGRGLVVHEVGFVHARPSGSLDVLRAHFATHALHFGQVENYLAFDASALDAPLLTHDPRLLSTVEQLADEAMRRRAPSGVGFRGGVELRVRGDLQNPELSIRTVARALGMSTRTLQRRLEVEGTSFAEVLDGVREQVARELLSSSEPRPSLTEIAFQLGFAEFATFSRAFKRWTGVSPGAFRQRPG